MHPAAKPVGDVRFLDAQGRTLRLADFKGRLVLINLWATWCPPCRLEMPALDKLQEALGPQGLSVVAVSMDKGGAQMIANFYRDNAINTLPMFFDPAWEIKKNFGIEGLPASVLISRDGWELGRANGWLNWGSPEMLVYLKNLLEAPNN
jgi:thiol-disulfide isomerase/thioredoxin